MAKEWDVRLVGTAEVSPDQLLAHPLNWRLHPVRQEDAVHKGLREVGWVRRILVNQRTGRILDGHLRVQLAKKKGAPTVPVEYCDVTEDEEVFILASLDSTVSLAEPNPETLRKIAQKQASSLFFPQGFLEKIFQAETPAAPSTETIDGGALRQVTHDLAPGEHRTSASEARIPLSVVLTTVQARQWREYKESVEKKSDTAAFLTLFNAVLAEGV